jgi:TonB family protein
MGWRSRATVIALMSSALCLLGSKSASATPKPDVCDPDSPGANTGLEVVSDLRGVDFSKYFANLLTTIVKNWPSVIPIEARGPGMKKGCSTIEFSISSDGSVGGMKVTASSGDEELDRASSLAISISAPFDSLPNGYARPEVVVRLRFLYNPDRRVEKVAISDAIRGRTTVTAKVVSVTGSDSPSTLYAPLPSYTARAIQEQKGGTVLISILVDKIRWRKSCTSS